METELYLAFIAASALLIAMPGPVVALVVATSIREGARAGLFAVAGAGFATAVHMTLVCAGLAAALAQFGEALFWIKWAGAAYLFYLGLRALLAKPSGADEATSGFSRRRAVAAGFLVALFNPKPLIFYAAFFPMFLSPDRAPGPQLLILGATYLIIAVALDSCWALFSSRSKPLLKRAGRWTNRISGGVLVAAAAALATTRKA